MDWAAFIVVLCITLDVLFCYVGIMRWGDSIEVNPIIRYLAHHLGLFTALFISWLLRLCGPVGGLLLTKAGKRQLGELFILVSLMLVLVTLLVHLII